MSVDQFLLSADTTDLNYPEIRPTLDLNFARVKALDPRITFTRASGGYYVGADGLIKYAGVNKARFDHNPITGESLGLLVEEQRANLLTRSEEFGTTWGALNSSISANATTAPDGATTADKVVENTATNVHGVSRASGSESLVNGTVYTFSVYAKAAERSFVWLQALNSFAKSYFNLTTGVVSASGAGHTSTITPVGNGWYRCAITFTSDQTNNSYRAIGMGQVSGTESYTGDGTSGLFLWGAQLEQASFPTSYIPTQGSTRTRAADIASITGKNFSDFYNQSEGTFFTSFRPAYNASATVPARTPHVLQAGNATTVNDNYTIRGAESNPYWTGLIRSASPSSLQLPGFNPYPYLNSSTQYKAALSVNTSLISVSLNGLLSADTSNTTTVNHTTPFNKLFIGSGTGGGPPYELNGHIAQLTYFPKRLPNAQLQALTR